jgi:hypothetical protein
LNSTVAFFPSDCRICPAQDARSATDLGQEGRQPRLRTVIMVRETKLRTSSACAPTWLEGEFQYCNSVGAKRHRTRCRTTFVFFGRDLVLLCWRDGFGFHSSFQASTVTSQNELPSGQAVTRKHVNLPKSSPERSSSQMTPMENLKKIAITASQPHFGTETQHTLDKVQETNTRKTQCRCGSHGSSFARGSLLSSLS